MSSFCSAKATHIFSAKNIRILYIKSAKTVNEMTLNELVKLTTLWTTGPRWSNYANEQSGWFLAYATRREEPELQCCSAKATHIFSAKNIRILYIESAKTVNEMTLNELVKLTTLWTNGPRWSNYANEQSGWFLAYATRREEPELPASDKGICFFIRPRTSVFNFLHSE